MNNEQLPNSDELINEHLDEFFDESEDILVLEEEESSIIKSNVFIIKANEERPYHILLSSGMSALAMKVPEGVVAPEFAEVMMLLPADWNLEEDAIGDEANNWPIRILVELCRVPHPDKDCVELGFTYEFSDDDAELIKNIGFNSVILLKSFELSSDFTTIEREDKFVEIFSVIPLYKEELEYNNKHGLDKLLEKFDKFEIEEIVRLGRPNTCL